MRRRRRAGHLRAPSRSPLTCLWSIIAAYRLMRAELQYRSLPWIWTLFLVFVLVVGARGIQRRERLWLAGASLPGLRPADLSLVLRRQPRSGALPLGPDGVARPQVVRGAGRDPLVGDQLCSSPRCRRWRSPGRWPRSRGSTPSRPLTPAHAACSSWRWRTLRHRSPW